MAQTTTGIRSILSLPSMYDFLQGILGVGNARQKLVQSYFPPGSGFRMLDIGCGTAEMLTYLPEDIRYEGFDTSEAYIQKAQQRFGHRGHFHAEKLGDATLDELGCFDVALSFGVVHHLDDHEAETLFDLAHKALVPGGVLVTIDPCYASSQHGIARWLIDHDRGQNVRNLQQYQSMAEKHFPSVRAVLHHDLLRVPYTYLILECRKGEEDHA